MKLAIGNKLKAIREERKMSQEEFSEFLGYNRASYQRIENNLSQLDIKDIVRLSDKLELPIESFLPELVNFHNKVEGQGGVVFGDLNNFYYYGNETDKNIDSEKKRLEDKIQVQTLLLEQLRVENEFLKTLILNNNYKPE